MERRAFTASRKALPLPPCLDQGLLVRMFKLDLAAEVWTPRLSHHIFIKTKDNQGSLELVFLKIGLHNGRAYHLKCASLCQWSV